MGEGEEEDQQSSSKNQQQQRFDKQCRNIALYGYCKYEKQGCLYKHSPTVIATSGQGEVSQQQIQFEPQSSKQSVAPDNSVGSSDYNKLIFSQVRQVSQKMAKVNIQQEYPEQIEYGQNAEFFQLPVVGSDGYVQPVHIDQLTYRHSLVDPLDHNIYFDASYLQNSSSSNSRQHHVESQLRHRILSEMQSQYNVYYNSSKQSVSVGDYHSVVQVDDHDDLQHVLSDYQLIRYHGISAVDSSFVTMIRVCGYKPLDEKILLSLGKYINGSLVDLPGVVKLKEAFSTRYFGDDSLMFIYDSFSSSTPLYHAFPLYVTDQNIDRRVIIDEVWSVLVQLLSLLHQIFQSGLFVGILNPFTIMRSYSGQIRLAYLGISHVLYSQSQSYTTGQLIHSQLNDLMQAVTLVASLALQCVAPDMINQPQQIIPAFINTFCNDVNSKSGVPEEQDLKNLILFILDAYHTEMNNVQSGYVVEKQIASKIISQCFPVMAPKLIQETQRAYAMADVIQSSMKREIENGRLFRLMVKLNAILERDHLLGDTTWAQTGDRYTLSLLRDYIFHQQAPGVNGMHVPILNMAHVLKCLNKLDCGSEENVLLVSRDESNCLILSWRDLKQCTERCFQELATASGASDSLNISQNMGSSSAGVGGGLSAYKNDKTLKKQQKY
ncbi:hypothetical protein MIR68_003719 [Amoeboaphelidium protococcarum]|nr:hypothetical protein MIR68_003719 [Amoeboaphelidium protococcarum]